MKKCVVILLLLLLPLSGCAVQNEPARAECFAMDTFISMQAYGKNAEAALSRCTQELTRLERLLSISSAEGDIGRVNAANGEPVALSAQTAALLGTALAVSAETDGAFDPTVYPLVSLWGFYGDEPRVPSQAALDEARASVDWRKVSLAGGVVTLPAGAKLDFGGIAKGYAGDALKAVLREENVTSAWLSLGGNVAVLGEKPDGSAWRIGIRDPLDESAVIGSVEARDVSIVTAGGYQRNFTQDGKTYHHIIDPKTGLPAESGLLSVTVIAPDGARADALSTALFVMGTQRALALWRSDRSFAAIFVESNGDILYTENAAFSPSNISKSKMAKFVE